MDISDNANTELAHHIAHIGCIYWCRAKFGLHPKSTIIVYYLCF